MSQPQPTFQRSTWVTIFPKWYEDYASSLSLICNDGEPSFYQEVMEEPNNAKWN